jgi:predicted nuclease with TOPRIM domain
MGDREDIADLRQVIEERDQRIETAEKESARIAATLRDSHDTIYELECELSRRNSQVADLERQVSDLERRAHELEDARVSLERRLREAERETARARYRDAY